MLIPTEPYLRVIRSELTTLAALCHDEGAGRAAKYCHRLLTQLLLRTEVLPALQQLI